jgi:hypothetical protein
VFTEELEEKLVFKREKIPVRTTKGLLKEIFFEKKTLIFHNLKIY